MFAKTKETQIMATSDSSISLPIVSGPSRQFSIPVEPVCSVVLAIALLILAEYAARNAWVSPLVMPAPSSIWTVLVSGFADGYFTGHLVSSAASLGSGFLLAFVLAIAIAGLLATSPFLEKVFTPFIIAFQSLPKVAVAPLVVLWLGFGEFAKITIVTIVCFFPIMVNTIQGLKVRDRDHYELMRSLGANRWQLFYYMRLPHAVPYIFAGVHIGVIFALIGTVVAEFVGTNSGIGYAMLQAKAQFDVAGVYACLLLLMVLGLALYFITAKIEQRVSFWINDLSRVAA